MAGEETDAGLNLIKYLSVEKGDIVSCPTFRRSNPSPSLSVSYLLASFCSAPFFRTRTDPWSRVREPRVYKGEARRYGVYVCSMISPLFTYDRSAAYRNVVKRRCHARRILVSHSLWHGRGGVTMYRFFHGYRARSEIVLTGSVRVQLFVTLSRTMIYFIPGFGEFVEESVYGGGWFMESEGNFYIRLLYTKWVDKSSKYRIFESVNEYNIRGGKLWKIDICKIRIIYCRVEMMVYRRGVGSKIRYFFLRIYKNIYSTNGWWILLTLDI